MSDRVPDWMVERLAAGELPPDEARRVRGRLEADGELERLARLERDNAAFLAAHPIDRVAAEIRRRAGEVPPWWRWLAFLAPAVAVAMLALWFVRAPGPTAPLLDDPEVVRPKGPTPYLIVYRKAAGGVERLADRARVRAGDTIQLAYVALARRYGVIASIDGRGGITLHLPEQAGRAHALTRSGETALPHSFVLDDSPGFERFVFLTADRELATATAVDVLRGAAPPPDVSISELTLAKELP
jgi:hypothetical protein